MNHVLIIGYVWPEPTSSAAGRRMMELISLFLSQHWKVTFASPAVKSEFTVDLKAIGVEETTIALNNASFDVFIKDLQPSIVLFDRFMMEEQFGWRVAEHCPSALRVLDMEDLHCLRKTRHDAFKKQKTYEEKDLLNDLAKREIASIYRCDVSLVISKIEMAFLTNFFKVPSELIYHLPFLLDTIDEKDKKEWPDFNQRQHFVTIGNFLHEPNRDSVLYLKEVIWPLIRRELPQAALHIYGAYESQQITQLNNPKEGFYSKGRTDDVSVIMRDARVCLSPLRFGAGLKGKFIDAMENGTPSITTSIGAEGMHDNFPWSGIIADKPEEIAKAAIKLYTSEKDWIKAQENGIKILKECYNKQPAGNNFIIYTLRLQKDLEMHRTHNFIGAMLMHHTLNSTKYMSKWIEEKNK